MHAATLCSSTFLSSGPRISPFPEIHKGLHRHGQQVHEGCVEDLIIAERSTVYSSPPLDTGHTERLYRNEIFSPWFFPTQDDFLQGQLR